MKEKPKPEISRDRRYNLLCIPWVAVIVLTFPGVFLFPQRFPTGLFRLFGGKDIRAWNQSWVAVGWFVYVALTVSACFARRKYVYFMIYTILCILLALNVAGCQMLFSELRTAEF